MCDVYTLNIVYRQEITFLWWQRFHGFRLGGLNKNLQSMV